MRFYARFACGNPHFHTSWYKISYDTRANKRFLDKCDYNTRLRLVLQIHTRQKTFHRTRIVMYYRRSALSSACIVSEASLPDARAEVVILPGPSIDLEFVS